MLKNLLFWTPSHRVCFRYAVSEQKWTQMLTSSVDDGSLPVPRYQHAAALLTNHDPLSGGQGSSHNFMLVVGGVTQKGVAMDTLSLNLSSLVWREYKVRVNSYRNSDTIPGLNEEE